MLANQLVQLYKNIIYWENIVTAFMTDERKMTFRSNKDLLIINVLSSLFVIFIFVTPTNRFLIILSLSLLLLFPGYCLVAILNRARQNVGLFEVLLLSFTLSLALISLVGLVISFTPWGISNHSIAIGIWLLILSETIISVYRHRNSNTMNSTQAQQPAKHPTSRKTWADFLLYGVVITSIIFCIIVVINIMITPKKAQPFTEFYILSTNADEDGVLYVTLRQSEIITLVVTNRENIPMDYRITTTKAGASEHQLYTFKLGPGSTGYFPFDFIAGPLDPIVKTEFLLYKQAKVQPSAQLYLWGGTDY